MIRLVDAYVFRNVSVISRKLLYPNGLCIFYRLLLLAPPSQIIDPCFPSPCGPYSECRNIGGSPSCSCRQGYIGTPPNCKPECTINSECPSSQACIREKCIDPCPGSCGIGALCTVVNHTPTCTCPERYTGDAFTNCYPEPEKRKLIVTSFDIHIYQIHTLQQ